MPNWCFTTVRFYTKNLEEMQRFTKDLKDAYENPVNPDAAKGWLGNFLQRMAGKNPKKYSCRGFVDDMDTSESEALDGYGYYSFSLYVEDAWGAHIAVWRDILAESYPKINLSYIAEESGCCVYIKHDDVGYFSDKYKLEGYLEGDAEDRFSDFEITNYFSCFDDVLFDFEEQFADDATIQSIVKEYEHYKENEIDNKVLDEFSDKITAYLQTIDENSSIGVYRFEDVDLYEF